MTPARERKPQLTPAEEGQFRRLVYQAWELRETPYLRDAVDAIVDWWQRTEPDRLERAR